MSTPDAKPTPPPARGAACPACGGLRTPAESTRRLADATVRVRRCRDCGRRFRTAERVQAVAH